MNVAKFSLIIIIYSHCVLHSVSTICTNDDLKKIENDENVNLECNPNQHTSLIYSWGSITYFGLNSNAYLDKTHFPEKFPKESSVTFKDLSIEPGYPTLTVRNLSLINVSISFGGNSFLIIYSNIGETKHHILYIDNCHFVDQGQLYDRNEISDLFYASDIPYNISISNSIFSKFWGYNIISFLGSKSYDNRIIFANNSFTNNRECKNFLNIGRSTLTFLNNTITFNNNIQFFLKATYSNIFFYNNTVSMNIDFTKFLHCNCNKPTDIIISHNRIKFNYVKHFFGINGQYCIIKIKHNHYKQNFFEYVIHSVLTIEQYYVLENEEFSLNNFTIFSFKNKSGKVTISNSTFQFGGFYQTLASCPLIDVKQLKNIKLISSNLTACDANIQKRIQFLCGNQYTVSQVECLSNKIKCDTNDYSLLKVVFPTGFAVLIGWIILNLLIMKVKKKWKKFFDKFTQTQLPEDNKSADSAENYYDTVD